MEESEKIYLHYVVTDCTGREIIQYTRYEFPDLSREHELCHKVYGDFISRMNHQMELEAAIKRKKHRKNIESEMGKKK